MLVIRFEDENYPCLLKEIYDPPQQLYYLGELKAREKFPLAVVGTRKISFYGKKATERLVNGLCQAGLTIVSGLALGVDGLAHQIALENGTRTIAVLGSGLDTVYPPDHKKLAKRIIDTGGALVSEYPPKTKPSKLTFPARNRIVAGMSLGVLVIEAPIKSGAMITARLALDQGREVFAVPGDIYSENSQGCNLLIKKGAKPVTKIEDILESFNYNDKDESHNR